MSQGSKVKRALISVSDKTGVVEFAQALVRMGVEIISTGGTAKALSQAGVKVIGIEDVTGFPEMMNGRVKTLHPKIHGGLLALRDNPEHVKAMTDNGITGIDLVCVNLYPFEQTVAKPGCTLEDAIENIDIGGPSMVRSAAKNYKFVAIVTSPCQYDTIVNEMKANGGSVTDATRADLARKAYALTAGYDAAISGWLTKQAGETFPQRVSIAIQRGEELRYGENPHQKAAYYRLARNSGEPCVAHAKQLEGGKQISFNNLMDTNAAFELVKEFDRPAAVVVKHMNPCGCAVDSNIVEAYRKAYCADVVSAFGGILAFNKPVTEELADAIAESYGRWGKALGAGGFFAEVIIAPSFDPAAVELIRTRKRWGKEDVRLLETGPFDRSRIDCSEYDVRGIVGGILLQQRDLVAWEADQIKCVTKRKPTPQEMTDLELAWTVVKHVKSNTIVLAKDSAVVGVGAGQMNRVDSGMLAIRQAKAAAKGACMASDAFFPFPDNVTQAAAAGIVAIVQPGGSKNDQASIDECDKNKMAMVFTGKRHFLH
ncbi:MAG: bifunctional phosphoribosylaminoimidazolecarboxamide formyltransferase/IMP cyclohydrolase [Sedimentisphaerales bacterium]|nr:bifunctional phosphoribosylaminoimidazolecarboxamide formyltransferase/IMP cyclohydrolase [Sedimentisphaerales bacterium]